MPKLLLVIIAALLLQGCAAALVAGGFGAAAIAHDRRTVGTQLDDKTLASRISSKLNDNQAIKTHTNVNVHVYNGAALLVGQTPNDHLKRDVQKIVESVPNLKRIQNQLRISNPTAISTRSHDLWLASKVKTQLLTDKRIDGLHIEVVVEDGEVFLMGLVKEEEANIAVDVVRHIDGVARVIKAFEYL